MFEFDRNSIPKNPGCYLFKDKRGDIIYVGKAKVLRNRVSSYFMLDHKNSPKTQFLVKNIAKIEFFVVDSEVEALLLENKLIKKHKPKYNIDLKDSKTYAYIKITNEDVPKIVQTRKVLNDKADYFGPFANGGLRRELFDLTVSLFNLITNKTYSSKSNLNFEIGKAPSRDLESLNLEEYLKNVEKAKNFLKGRNVSEVLRGLKVEMDEFSFGMKFELALEKKKQIEAINLILEKQKVDLLVNYDQDFVVLFEDVSFCVIFILNVSKGVISSKKEFKFREYDSKEELFLEFLKMYYSKNCPPKEVAVQFEVWEDDSERVVLEDYLSNLRGSKVSLISPKKGDKLKLINLAYDNAKIKYEKEGVLKEMKDKIGLPKIPRVIECFDMSNLSYDFLVGGMTRWVDGFRDEDNFRKFDIKSFSGKNDDFASMKEVVYRRYKAIKDGREVGGEFPDLIIIDGGKGQLKMAIEALREVGVRVPIISLAKKEEEIFILGKEDSLKFDKNSPMMLFIRGVRDSVHNFVVSFNRKKRKIKAEKEFFS